MTLTRMAVVLAVASLAARLYVEIRRRDTVTGRGAGAAAPRAPAQERWYARSPAPVHRTMPCCWGLVASPRIRSAKPSAKRAIWCGKGRAHGESLAHLQGCHPGHTRRYRGKERPAMGLLAVLLRVPMTALASQSPDSTTRSASSQLLLQLNFNAVVQDHDVANLVGLGAEVQLLHREGPKNLAL